MTADPARSLERGGTSDRISVAFYTDAGELGGAELSLGNLLAALSPRVEAAIVGTSEDVVGRLAQYRPLARTIVVSPIDGPLDASSIRDHVRAFRRLRPDIVHVNLNHPWACGWAQLAAIATPGARVIAVEHLPRPPLHRWDPLLKRLVEKGLDAHVVVGRRSADELGDLAHIPRGRLTTIHNGVRAVELEPTPRVSAGFVIGSLGRLHAQKGYDVLVRALVSLEGVTAVIVGGGEERAALLDLAEELGVRDRLVLRDWSDEARSCLTSFDVFVLPSRFEAFPLTIVEAMLAGVPVVASDVGSVVEAVLDGSTGLLVPPGDAEALADAVRGLAEDPERRRELGERGRRRALELFTAEAMAARYEALYDEVLP